MLSVVAVAAVLACVACTTVAQDPAEGWLGYAKAVNPSGEVSEKSPSLFWSCCCCCLSCCCCCCCCVFFPLVLVLVLVSCFVVVNLWCSVGCRFAPLAPCCVNRGSSLTLRPSGRLARTLDVAVLSSLPGVYMCACVIATLLSLRGFREERPFHSAKPS